MTDRNSTAALRGQTCLDPEIVDMMKALVTGQTDEALNDRFGINYNSWRKLIAGRPVRHSLAQRVIMIASSS